MAARTSRFNAYCNARLYSAEGDGPIYTFSLVPGGEAEEVHVPFMTGATIQRKLGDLATQMTVNFDAPFEEGVKMLKSNAFATNSILEMEMGYAGSQEGSGLVFGSIMDAQKSVNLTPEGLTGSVTAKIGPTIPSRYKKSGARFIDNVLNPALLSHLIRAYAADAGYADVLYEGDAQEKVDEVSSYFISGRPLSLMEILNRLTAFARVLWTSEVYQGEYVLVIQDIASFTAWAPTRRFVMRGGLFEATDELETYPIIALSPDIKGFTFGTVTPKVSSGDIGRDGKPKYDSKTPSETTEKSGAKKTDAKPDDPAKKGSTVVSKEPEEGETGVVIENPNPESSAPPPTEATQQKIATLSVSLTTVGVPSIASGAGASSFESVEVVGTGVFDGVYQVNQATHTWTGAAIDTTLELMFKKYLSDAGPNAKELEAIEGG